MSHTDSPVPSGPWCAACTNPAEVRVRHPEHGQRTVCEEHARDFEVIEHV